MQIIYQLSTTCCLCFTYSNDASMVNSDYSRDPSNRGGNSYMMYGDKAGHAPYNPAMHTGHNMAETPTNYQRFVYPHPVNMYGGAMMYGVPGQQIGGYSMTPVSHYGVPTAYMHGSVGVSYPPPPPSHMSMTPGYAPSTPVAADRPSMQQSMSEGRLNHQVEMRQSHNTPGHSLMKHSVSSPKVTDSQSMSSHVSHSSPQSSLLPQIKLIPDLERRISRLDITLMNLEDDLKEVDSEANVIMLDNPNFFQDERYQTLAKRKRSYLREQKELKEYRADVEKAVEEVSRESIPKAEIETATQIIARKLQEVGISEPPTNASYPVYAYMEPQGPPVCAPPAETLFGHGMSPAGSNFFTPDPSGTRHPAASPQTSENPPHLTLDSLSPETNDQAINRMLVLDQSPFAPKSPNSHKGNSSNSQSSMTPVSYPPTIQKMPESKQKQDNIPFAGSNEATGEDWACEHCTYRNSSTDKSCVMCYKTSSRRVISQVSNDKPKPQTLPAPPSDPISESCEHCTFMNPTGSKVCQMCNKSQTKYQRQESDFVMVSESLVNDVPPEAVKSPSSAMNITMDEAVVAAAGVAIVPVTHSRPTSGADCNSPKEKSSPVGKLIDQEQDRVSSIHHTIFYTVV